MNMSFQDLKVGDQARVSGFKSLDNSYRNRLLSMGLTPGTLFEVKRVAPLADPVEILVRGFRLSLRRDEAAGVLVELVE
ncbi:MAG: FeoA family protein [Pseudomonadales bacterium]